MKNSLQYILTIGYTRNYSLLKFLVFYLKFLFRNSIDNSFSLQGLLTQAIVVNTISIAHLNHNDGTTYSSTTWKVCRMTIHILYIFWFKTIHCLDYCGISIALNYPRIALVNSIIQK